MKPLYVIDEPVTRLYQSPEERRLRNTEAQREKRKKMSSGDKDRKNLQSKKIEEKPRTLAPFQVNFFIQ